MHISNELYLGKLLEKRHISVSAPSRLDVGGTWDIKGLALTHPWLTPCTINIAISLRTKATLLPYDYGRIKISNNLDTLECAIDEVPLEGPLKLLCAIASHFGLHGYELQLAYQAPPFSGLGGSGTVGVAFIAALFVALDMVCDRPVNINATAIAELAYNLEDSLDVSLCGMQDHCAAAFGGINKWNWKYSSSGLFEQDSLHNEEITRGLNDRLIVVYLGQSHNSRKINKLQMDSFWNIDTRKNWFTINEIAQKFYSALENSNWEEAAQLVKQENALRIAMVPARLNRIAYELFEITKSYKAGFAAAGAGDGGCVWVLCSRPQDKILLENQFRDLVGTDGVLGITVEELGIKVE